MPIKITSGIQRCLDCGFIYIHGRDRCFRPIVVVRPALLQEMSPKPDTNDIMLAIIAV